FLPLLLASIRGALRVVGVADLLSGYRSQINAQSWIYITIGVFMPFLYLINFFSSLISRQIRWRGIRYELVSQYETRVLTPQSLHQASGVSCNFCQRHEITTILQSPLWKTFAHKCHTLNDLHRHFLALQMHYQY